MSERMTLDDVIKEFIRVSKEDEIITGDAQARCCAQYLKTHKLALERGMQKPLRFQRIKARQFVYILLDTQDRQVMKESFVNKDAAIKFASDLDLPCEFIED